MIPKRRSNKPVVPEDRPATMKGAFINEGIGHWFSLCDDYLTNNGPGIEIECVLVRPIEMSVVEFRAKAIEWRFAQTTRRNEIQDLLKERALSPANRNRMGRIGSWEA